MPRPALLFPIGALIFSPGVDRLMREYRFDPMPFVGRHAQGDWGEVDAALSEANNAGLMTDNQLESRYVVNHDLNLSIITLSDRSATHVKLAFEA
ncbi:hypothetical protein ACV33W_08530 [Pseudomonas aeruginosa]